MCSIKKKEARAFSCDEPRMSKEKDVYASVSVFERR